MWIWLPIQYGMTFTLKQFLHSKFLYKIDVLEKIHHIILLFAVLPSKMQGAAWGNHFPGWAPSVDVGYTRGRRCLISFQEVGCEYDGLGKSQCSAELSGIVIHQYHYGCCFVCFRIRRHISSSSFFSSFFFFFVCLRWISSKIPSHSVLVGHVRKDVCMVA